MGRGKLSMELIKKEKSRNTTFQKRKKSLMKKAYEFSTLCDVKSCVIIYGLKQDGFSPQPETWPTDSDEVRRIINKYKSKSNDERKNKTVGLSDFFLRRKKKIDVETDKLRKENVEAKFPTWDESLETFSEDQLRLLVSTLDHNLEVVRRKIMIMKGEDLIDKTSSSSGLFFGGSSTQLRQNYSNYYQGLLQNNLEFEPLNPDPICSVNPLDQTQIPNYYTIPFDQNLVDNDFYTQLGDGSLLRAPMYQEPMSAPPPPLNSAAAFHNFGNSIWNCPPPTMLQQPMLPYAQYPMMRSTRPVADPSFFSSEQFQKMCNEFGGFE